MFFKKYHLGNLLIIFYQLTKFESTSFISFWNILMATLQKAITPWDISFMRPKLMFDRKKMIIIFLRVIYFMSISL